MELKILNIFFILLFGSPCFAQQIHFDSDFILGVANAPGHVEDNLSDIWLAWGQQGNIKGWENQPNAEKRLQFWTAPEKELDLAQKIHAQSFRMGIDWGRAMPGSGQFDEKVLQRYREIFQMTHARKMKVMVSLMHHSVPKWIQEMGGWRNPETKKHFVEFSQRMMSEFQFEVDWWITFNEPNVFVTMAYTVGAWPPGQKPSTLSLFALGPWRGSSIEALDLMATAHNEIYDWAHQRFPNSKIGIANNMAHYTGQSFFSSIVASYIDGLMNWRFPEMTGKKVDFFGINYYGAEWLKLGGIEFNPEEEYSEAGRAIDVNGLYNLLVQIHQKFPKLPIIITENGIADATDTLRGAYLIEHLHAVAKARQNNIPVQGYYVWTLTDNLEWSDGYCPKFGLVGIDRKTMNRTLRPSADLFSKISTQRQITSDMRQKEWEKVVSQQGKPRPFCRDSDGVTAYDTPQMRNFSSKDWRFTR